MPANGNNHGGAERPPLALLRLGARELRTQEPPHLDGLDVQLLGELDWRHGLHAARDHPHLAGLGAAAADRACRWASIVAITNGRAGRGRAPEQHESVALRPLPHASCAPLPGPSLGSGSRRTADPSTSAAPGSSAAPGCDKLAAVEPESLEGQWWLPSTPERQRFGRIECEDSWTLVVEGGLRTPPELQPDTGYGLRDRTTEKTLVYGNALSGQSVTLVGCRSSGLDWPIEPQQETWRIESIVEGAHLEDADEPMSEVRIRLGPLRTWTCAARPQVEWDSGRVTVQVENQVLGEAHLEEATIRLVADHACSLGEDRATVDRGALFEVKPRGGVGLRDAINSYVLPLRSLIAFCTMTYTNIQPLEAIPAQTAGDDDRVRPVTYRTQLQRPTRLPKQPWRHDMLVTFPDVPYEFQMLIEHWLNLIGTQKKAINLLLMPDWSPYLYAEDKFLSAFQAVESYHDHAIGGTAVPQPVHTARVQAIVASAPQEHREWLRNVLGGKNSKGQERKLAEVIDRAGSTGQAVLTALPNFAMLAAKTRHKIAHPSSYDMDAGARFVFLGRCLRWMLRHCLLLDLGFIEEQVMALIKRSRDFEHDLGRLAALHLESN